MTLPPHEPVAALAAVGVRAFVTTRGAGSYGLPLEGRDADVEARWVALQQAGGDARPALASPIRSTQCAWVSTAAGMR